MKELLKKYCNAFGPSGLEDEVRELINGDVAPYADSVSTDGCGNLIVFKKGKERRPHKLLLSAHMDEVGFMITYFSDEGFAYFETIGGIDPRVIAGKRVSLGSRRIPAVVAAKAIHMQKPKERGVPEKISDMFIDFGCVSKEDSLYKLSIGDCAVFEPNFSEFGSGFIKSKAIDDRAGCAVLVSLLKKEAEYDTYYAFTTAEEVGCRGAAAVAASIGAEVTVVIESTTAGDIAGTPKSRQACRVGDGAVISFMDGSTVYPRELVDISLELAAEKGIKVQLKNLAVGGNEAGTYQRTAYGSRVLALSAPVRYIHSSCSVVKEDDLMQLYALAEAITERSTLI